MTQRLKQFLTSVLIAAMVLTTGVFSLPVAAESGDFDATVVSAEWSADDTITVEFDKDVTLGEDAISNMAYETYFEMNFSAKDKVTVDGKKVNIKFDKGYVSSVSSIIFKPGALQNASGVANAVDIKATPVKFEKEIYTLQYSTSELTSDGGQVTATVTGKLLNVGGGWVQGVVYQGDTPLTSIQVTYDEFTQTFTFNLPANSEASAKEYKLKVQTSKWDPTPVAIKSGGDSVITVAGTAPASTEFDATVVSAEWTDDDTITVKFDKDITLDANAIDNMRYERYLYKTYFEFGFGAADRVTANGTDVSIKFANGFESSVSSIIFNPGAIKTANGAANTATVKATPVKLEQEIYTLTYAPTELTCYGGIVTATVTGKRLNVGGGNLLGVVYYGDRPMYSIVVSYDKTAKTFSFELPANTGTADKNYKLKILNVGNGAPIPIPVQSGGDSVVTVPRGAVGPNVNSITYNKTSFPTAGGEVTIDLEGEYLTQLTRSDLLLIRDCGPGDGEQDDPSDVKVTYTATDDANARVTFTLPPNSNSTDMEYWVTFKKGADDLANKTQLLTVKADTTHTIVDSLSYSETSLFSIGGEIIVTITGENLTNATAADFVVMLKNASDLTLTETDVEVTYTAVSDTQAVARFTLPENEGTAEKIYIFGTYRPVADEATGVDQDLVVGAKNESQAGKFYIPTNKWAASYVANGVIRVKISEPAGVTLNSDVDIKDYIYFTNAVGDSTATMRNLTEDDKVEVIDDSIYIELADKEAAVPFFIVFKQDALKNQAGESLGKDEFRREHNRYVISEAHIDSISYNKITFTNEGGEVVATAKGTRLDASNPALFAKVFIDGEKNYSQEVVPSVTVNSEGTEAVFKFTVPANTTDRTISYRMIPVISDVNVITQFIKGYDVISVLPQGGKETDVTLSSVEVAGSNDLDDARDVFKTSTTAAEFTNKIDVILRGTNLSGKKTAIKIVDENGVVWPSLPVFECGATIRWQSSAGFLPEKESKNEQSIELLIPRRLGVPHTFTMYFAPDGKNFLDGPTATVIVDNQGLFDEEDMVSRGYDKEDLTELREIVVKYVDEAGNDLAPADRYPAYGVTELYHLGIGPKEIEGYQLKSFSPNMLTEMLEQPIINERGKYIFPHGQYFQADLEGEDIVYTYKEAKEVAVQYRTGIQGSTSWQDWRRDGALSGTTGKGLRLEGLQVKLPNDLPYEGGIRYNAQIQNIGWQGWKANGETAGFNPKKSGGLRLESIKIELTGEMAKNYDVWYHMHTQRFGWMGWAKNGEAAGTVGYAFRVEAIEVVVLPKGSPAPTSHSAVSTTEANMLSFVRANSYDNKSWQGAKGEGDVSGTRGKKKTAIKMALSQSGIPDKYRDNSGITYRVYQDGKWSAWAANDKVAGKATGGAIQGLQVKLTGNIAKDYDVYYRVEVKNGTKAYWMNWAKNGASAGYKGKNLEQIQVAIVPKGEPAPTLENAKQRFVLKSFPTNASSAAVKL